jgi:putative flippase GtrA
MAAMPDPVSPPPAASGGLQPHLFVRFFLVNGFAAAMNFGSRLLFSLFLPYTAAIVLAFFVGLGTAFVLGRLFVFTGATNTLREQLFYFSLVSLLGLVQVVLISLSLVHWLLPAMGIRQYAETLAHGVGIAVPMVTSYFGHKHFSFSQSRAGRAADSTGSRH